MAAMARVGTDRADKVTARADMVREETDMAAMEAAMFIPMT